MHNSVNLNINTDKTVAVLFARSQSNNLKPILVKNKLTPWSNSVKYLEVTIGRTLKLNQHVRNKIGRAIVVRCILYPIINHKRPVPLKSKINILKMYITTILTYAGTAWVPHIYRTDLMRLEAVQTSGLRLITHTSKYVRNNMSSKAPLNGNKL